MTRTAAVVHPISGGFCLECGDTAEWLSERGGIVQESS